MPAQLHVSWNTIIYLLGTNMDLSMTSRTMKDRHNTYHLQVLNEQMTFAIVLIPLMQESVPPSNVLFNSLPVQVASLTYTSHLLQHRARRRTKKTVSIKKTLDNVNVKTKHNIAQRFLWAIHHNNLDDPRNQPRNTKIPNGIELVKISVLFQFFFALHANQLQSLFVHKMLVKDCEN